MSIFKITFFISIISILLIGCNEVKEKKSDPKILLDEKENQLPASSFKEPDLQLGKKLLSSLSEEIEPIKSYSKTIDKKNANVVLKDVSWIDNKAKVNIKVLVDNATLYIDKHYVCTQSGFFFCKSGYTDDNRFKLHDKNKDKEYTISGIDGFPTKVTRFHSDGSSYEGIRESIKTKKDNIYTLLFDIPLASLRYFDIYERYCDGSDKDWKVCNNRITLFNEELKQQEDILALLSTYKLNNISIEDLKDIKQKFPKYDKVTKVVEDAMLNRISSYNSIEKLNSFISDISSKDVKDKAIEDIYKLVKIKDSVAGYEWFIKNYSYSKYSNIALKRIHEIMFDKAQKVDTISAYNSFIYAYPTASQVAMANDKANEKELKIYTDLGLLGFWDEDHKKEKKSRQLLIKAKQIERYPANNNLDDSKKSGYLIVANRMYQLLQNEFNDSDATLRYLESQEFKDFIKTFKEVMDDIKSSLRRIANNTSSMSRYTKEMVEVSRAGFSDARSDRALAAYYTKKQNDWEKNMHLRDKGYN